MNASIFPQNIQLDPENVNLIGNEMSSQNEISKNKEISNVDNNKNSSSDNVSELNPLSPIQTTKKTEGKSDVNRNKEKEKDNQKEDIAKIETSEDLIQKIVEAIKQKAPQDPRIRNKK